MSEGSPSYTPAHLSREVLPARESQAGERKEVTVLLADVAGSLATAHVLDPEDVHSVMDGFFAIALDVVHAEGGTINQFRGDGFMALFGAPRARGHDSSRALRAALEIRDLTRGYADSVMTRFGVPFALRMGVNTGLVWVGRIGSDLRRDYTAEGPTVGLAARLEQDARPGQILVGESTVSRCGDYFGLSALGRRTLRGIEEPLEVYELVGAGPHAERLDLERSRGLTPFVGRQGEIEVLRDFGHRRGVHVLEIRGEAGVGKSRLVHEHVRQIGCEVPVLWLRCRESQKRQAYMPWLDLLRCWPETRASPPGLASRIRELEGIEDAEGSGRSGEEVLVELVSALCATGRTLLVVEDIQWCDPSSHKVLTRLAELDAPALSVISTLREECGPTAPIADPTCHLRLEPLDEADARELAERILADSADASALASLAVARGGGNALFIEEVARSLAEGSDDLRRAALLEISLLRAPERIPLSLDGVVAARIDALPWNAKRLLEATAVAAVPSATDLLREADPEVGDGIAGLVSLLAERGLVQVDTAGKIELRHGLIRDVAYGQLIRERRRELHVRFAEALVRRGAARSADGMSLIGGHYDRADDGANAARYLALAGLAYAGLDAPAEAAGHLYRALELARTAERRDARRETELALALAACLNSLDRTGDAAAVLEGVDASTIDPRDRIRLAAASIQSGWVQFAERQEVQRSRILIERGLEFAEGLTDSARVRLLGRGYLARILNLDGDVTSSARICRELVEQAIGAADSTAAVFALHNEVFALCDAGQVARARASAEAAGEIVATHPSEMLEMISASAWSRVHLFEGEPAAAIAAANRASALSARTGQLGIAYIATVQRGYAHSLAGQPRESHSQFEHLAQLQPTWPTTALHRARGRLEAGDLDGAIELARGCVDGAPPQLVGARATAVLGLCLGLRGDGARGEELLANASSTCEKLGASPYLAEARRFLAELLCERRAFDRATWYARSAAEEFARCGMPLHAREAAAIATD